MPLAPMVATAALLAAALGPAAAPVVAPGAGPAAADSGGQSAGGYARGAFQATNHQRAERDLVRLDRSGCLQRKAVKQARKMAKRGEIFHQDLYSVLEDCELSSAGENVASGFPTGRATVNRGWMRSAGHRANILGADYRLMGLAARKADGVWYVAQVFGKH